MRTQPSLKGVLGELLDEVHALASDAEKALGQSVAAHSAEAVDVLRKRIDRTRERLAVVCEDLGKTAVAGAKRADEAVRGNPYQTAAVALAAGVLAGVLLGRRIR